MNQQLQVFNHEQFGDVRIIEEDGKVLFCGSDVAKALGYENPRDAIRRHCRCVAKRDAWVQTGTKSDGTPAMRLNSTNFIPEGDVYRLITHSKLPAAERFEKWVFDEVLPTIRKTGGYGQQINLEQLTKIIAMTVQATVKELLPSMSMFFDIESTAFRSNSRAQSSDTPAIRATRTHGGFFAVLNLLYRRSITLYWSAGRSSNKLSIAAQKSIRFAMSSVMSAILRRYASRSLSARSAVIAVGFDTSHPCGMPVNFCACNPYVASIRPLYSAISSCFLRHICVAAPHRFNSRRTAARMLSLLIVPSHPRIADSPPPYTNIPNITVPFSLSTLQPV